jgi:type II secretory pathway component GspD/PulD (secretin)
VLQHIVRRADVTYYEKDGVFHVVRRVGMHPHSSVKTIERAYVVECENQDLFTVQLDSADIRAVLKDVAVLGEVQIQVQPSVSGTVSLRARHLTLEELMPRLLDQVGAKSLPDGKGFRVVPK